MYVILKTIGKGHEKETIFSQDVASQDQKKQS